MVKSNKDSAKPKGKMSAYQCFMVEFKNERKSKNPGEPLKLAELSKDVSEKWKNISVKDKKKYEEMSMKDTKRYKEEMADYTPANIEPSKKRKREQKDPNAPKRALTSFFFFCAKQRPSVKEDHPGSSIGEVAKEMGKRWEACKERGTYEEMARKDKERYAKEKESYVPESDAPKKKESKPAAKGRKKQKLEKSEDEEERENEEEDEEEDDESD